MSNFYNYDTRGASAASQIINLERMVEERDTEISRLRQETLVQSECIETLHNDIKQLNEEIKRLRKESKNVGKGAERNAHISYEFARKNNALRQENERLHGLLQICMDRWIPFAEVEFRQQVKKD